MRQLESDIEGIRECIAKAEHERRDLRAANQAYRSQLLTGRGGDGSDDASGAMVVGVASPYDSQEAIHHQYYYDGQQQQQPGFNAILGGDDALLQQAKDLSGGTAFHCFDDAGNQEYLSSSAGDEPGLMIGDIIQLGLSAHYYDPGRQQQQPAPSANAGDELQG